MMRIVFMGTPIFALPALKALHEAGHDIVAVYSQPPRPAGRGQKETPSVVHQYALEHSFPVYTPTSLKSSEVQTEFADHKADYAIVAAYGLLLPKPILDAYPLGCINIHPSLLPRWRGAAPIQRTIMAGDKDTGIAIMQMDEGLDTGDILAMQAFGIPDGMNAGELHAELSEHAAPLLLATLKKLQEGTCTPVKQLDTGVEYAKKITKDECALDFSKSSERLYHQILGLSPAPGAYFTYNGEHIKIFDATFDNTAHGKQHSTILNDQLAIACGDGVLYPKLLQRPNKKRMLLGEFLNGFTIPTHATL
jgi:methionyl-tRNA formyltransferase